MKLNRNDDNKKFNKNNQINNIFTPAYAPINLTEHQIDQTSATKDVPFY